MNRALVVAVGVTALAGATLSRAAPTFAATQNTVVVYTDSLGTEARPVLIGKLQGATPGIRVMVRAKPGVAMCDWLPVMVADQRLHPRLVVLAFYGNYGTACMANRDYTRAWKSDDRAAVQLWLARGARVLIVGDPSAVGQPTRGATSPPGEVLRDDATVLAAQHPSRVHYVNAGATLVNPKTRRYARFLSCLPGETTAMGCGSKPAPPGEIVVRQDDQIHLCSTPTPASLACPRYSSGVVRWSTAIAQAVRTWR